MREQALWYWPGLIPVLSGLGWLAAGGLQGWSLLLALVPGLVHVGAGVGLLLWPGDRRISQCLALSCFIAVLLIIPAWLLFGIVWALVLLVLAVASYLVAGFAAVRHEPVTEGIPKVKISLRLVLMVALDEALLGYFTLSAHVPAGERARKMYTECERMRIQYRARDPHEFHRHPVPPHDLRLRKRRIYRQSYEHVDFDSGYQPWNDDPGAQTWQAQLRNRRAHAWMMRHPGPPRPWLIGIHGYRMGLPWMDFGLFPPRWLHHRLGLNLLLPVLPLHGPRRAGLRSGDSYMDGDFTNFIHAEAQAMHDIRSMILWLRAEHRAQTIGVLGYSLGGYNAALLSCLEEDLACIIAGIPMVDISATLWRHMPLQQKRYLESKGLGQQSVSQALRVVSPLVMSPKTRRRYLFAGLSDRLIPPDQVQRLAEHWQLEHPAWYQGTHLSFGNEPAVTTLILRALREGGLTSGN